MRSATTFELARPRSVSEAVAILLEAGDRASLLAGGTDLVVRMKRGLRRPDVVVDLGQLEELKGIERDLGTLRLGAMATAAEIASHPLLRSDAGVLAEAARSVGGVQIRGAATVGGGLAGGLRCGLLDQSDFWRGARGPCRRLLHDAGCPFSTDGGCVATVACDMPPALAALDAAVEIAGPAGSRRIPVASLYTGHGLDPLALAPGELIVAVRVPVGLPSAVSTYRKLRLRRAVDRPLLGIALAAHLLPGRNGARVHDLRVALSGVGPAVRLVPGLEKLEGARAGASLEAALGRMVEQWVAPSPAIRVDVAWRRAMAGVLARRGLRELCERARRARRGERAAARSRAGRSPRRWGTA